MAEMKENYVDGIGQIHFIAGTIRCDFVTLQPGENGKAPTPVVSERIIMNPQGFLNTYNSMQQMLNKLLESGVFPKAPAANADAAKTAKQ